ncbi:MAG: hypothetical protein WA990_14820 [Rubrobacteraceae bacterium]
MSRLVIIGGLAAILISLVAFVTLAGSSPPTEDLSSQETRETAQEPDTEPGAPTTPETTPEAPRDQAAEQNPQAPQEEETPVQGVQPDGQEDGQADDPAGADGRRGPAGIGPRVATVEIAGDGGYSCSLGLLGSPRTVRGTNPASFQVRVTPGGTRLDTVMAVCQKIDGEELGIGIIYDGEVVAQEDTSVQFGTVSVSWSPVQQ